MDGKTLQVVTPDRDLGIIVEDTLKQGGWWRSG